MPEPVWIWTIEKAGLIKVSAPRQLVTLDEASSFLPAGAYTTFRTYQHDKSLPLADHFRRLEHTALLAGKDLHSASTSGLSFEGGIRQAVRQVLAIYSRMENLRIRLIIDLEIQPGKVYIIAQPLQTLPAEAYQRGVKAVTCHFRRVNPEAKLTDNIAGAQAIRKRLPGDVNEALILDDDGMILEGLSSNFFAVRDGELWTAQSGILSGITRTIVLQIAVQADIPVRLQPIHCSALGELDEAFITSASREVLPVRQVDEWVIGSGQPGSLARLLAGRYRLFLEQALQVI